MRGSRFPIEVRVPASPTRITSGGAPYAPLSFRLNSTARGKPTMHRYFRPKVPPSSFRGQRGKKRALPREGKGLRPKRKRRPGFLSRGAEILARLSTAVCRRRCPLPGLAERHECAFPCRRQTESPQNERKPKPLSMRRLIRSFHKGICFTEERGLSAVITAQEPDRPFSASLGVPTASEFDL